MKTFALIKNYFFVLVIALLLVPIGCDDDDDKNEKHTQTYPSEVVREWLDVQVGMLYAPTGNPFGFNPSRYMAYCGVALYESVVPGMPEYQSLQGQLTDMPAMPATDPGLEYHWPSSANAALAAMTKNFFSVTSAYNESAIVTLENELNEQYRAEVGDAIFERSVEFGK
ncbi:MAG TPA: hypothetical protein VEW65_01740, partial [Chryseolinea sp.]|nr:hypothetical protein [Chryseolinea sp.]